MIVNATNLKAAAIMIPQDSLNIGKQFGANFGSQTWITVARAEDQVGQDIR